MRKAYDLFEMASAMQHTAAQFMVADFLLGNGDGVVPEDPTVAIQLLYEAGEKGHRRAREQLLNILDGKTRFAKKTDGVWQQPP